jgi:hypothetical protein
MTRGNPKQRSEATCELALDKHEAHLASRQNVVGLGIVRLDEADDSDDELAVAVYVSKKLPLAELPAGEVIPKELTVEHEGEAHKVRTRVIEQGEVAFEEVGPETL